MDMVMFIVALAVVGGVGYWMYTTNRGPFGDE